MSKEVMYEGRLSTDEISPSGNNSSTAGESFYQSHVYDSLMPMQRPYFAEHHGNMSALYGKVDELGYILLPKQDYIFPIPSVDDFQENEEEEEEKPQPLATSMVRDCFIEMSAYYKTLRQRNKLDQDSIILSLKPVNSWYNVIPDYFLNFSKTFEHFNEENRNNQSILEYSDYEKTMVEYLGKMIASLKPATLSEFIIKSSPLATGLFVEIYDGEYGDDAKKYTEFVSDPNFNIYRKVAKRFGFKVDKNIPWRIFLDFKSPYIIEKMNNLGMNSIKEFFSFYYEKACIYDCQSMYSNFRAAYEDLYRRAPYVSYFSCGTKTKERIPFKSQSPSRGHFLKVYMYLRALETRRTWSQSKFDSIFRSVLVVDKYRGFEAAIEKAEGNFKDRSSETFQKNSLTTRNQFDILRSNASRGPKFNY